MGHPRTQGKKTADQFTTVLAPIAEQALFAITRGGDNVPKDPESLAMKSTYNKFFVLVNTVVLAGNAVLFLVAYLSKFPLTPAEAAAAYPSIMDVPAFVTAILLGLFFFLAFFDAAWCILVYCGYMNSDTRQKVILTRHSNITSMRFFLSQACIMIGNSLLWFEFSPWYYFGLNIGAISFIILMVNYHSILYTFKGLFAFCKGDTARKAVKEEYEKYLEDIRGNDYRETVMWQVPLDLIKAYLLFQVFASLFASATFENTELGAISQTNLYIVLTCVFILFATTVYDFYLQKRACYLFILSFYEMFLAIQQAGVNGGVSVLDLWATSTAVACFFFVLGVWATYASLMEHARYLASHSSSKGENHKIEEGIGNLLCGINPSKRDA